MSCCDSAENITCVEAAGGQPEQSCESGKSGLWAAASSFLPASMQQSEHLGTQCLLLQRYLVSPCVAGLDLDFTGEMEYR